MKLFNRELGLVEKYMALGHDLGSGLIVNVVYIEGFLTPDIVKKALKLVQQRHPMLQVYIVESEDELYFESKGITEIPLQVIYKKDDNDVIKIAEKELHTKFTKDKKPLCRLILSSDQNANTSEIVITFHHGIVDGISCMSFIDDLLFYCQQINDRQDIPQVETLDFLPPIENIINYNIVNQINNKNNQVNNKEITPPAQLIIEGKASANERSSKMLPRMLSQENTKILIEKCRQEKTTVHGAICAALLFAAAKSLSIDKQINFSYGSPINLRKYCAPQITNQNLGCFISALGFNQLVEYNTIFWDLARECKSKVHKSLNNGVHINVLQQAKLRNFDRDMMVKSILSKENTMGRNNIFSISNRGKFKFRNQGDKLKIKELYFATGQHIGGDCFWLGILTLNQQLFCNFAYAEPVISYKTAQLFADDSITVIEEACIKKDYRLTMLYEKNKQN